MSVILVLLPVVYLAPLAVGAAAAAAKAIEKRSRSEGILRVETRMKNESMVAIAMERIGYKVERDGGSLVGKSGASALTMSRNAEGLWVGQFSAEKSEEQAVQVLNNLDVEYGKLVQSALIKRLEERLPESNLQMVQQVTNQDQSITVMLTVNA
jgi:hypothetical protein